MHAGEASLKPGTSGRASTPPFAVTSTRSSSPTRSPAIPATDSAWAIPSPLTSFPTATTRSQIGDVVALEPGLYIPGEGGMRYERNYLITADGFQTLSHHEIRVSQ